jgi:hypothetical protein
MSNHSMRPSTTPSTGSEQRLVCMLTVKCYVAWAVKDDRAKA